MTDLTPDKLREIAGKIYDLLDEFEIDTERFDLEIRVPREYYEAIKQSFPKRHRVVLVVVEVPEGNWDITLTCAQEHFN
jgi:hypothetical protein